MPPLRGPRADTHDLQRGRRGPPAGTSPTPRPPAEGGLQGGLFADLPEAEGQGASGDQPFSDLSAYEAAAQASPYTSDRTKTRRRRQPRRNYGPRDGLPWERGMAEAKFFSTTFKVLFSPHEAFGVMRRKGGVGRPLGYAIAGATFGWAVTAGYLLLLQAITLGIGLVRMAQAEQPADENLGRKIGAAAIVLVIALAISLVATLIGAIISSFVTAGLYHLVLMMLDSADHGFETTYRVVAYCQGATSVLWVIPCRRSFPANHRLCRHRHPGSVRGPGDHGRQGFRRRLGPTRPPRRVCVPAPLSGPQARNAGGHRGGPECGGGRAGTIGFCGLRTA